MKKRILFIINPKAGSNKKRPDADLIAKVLEGTSLDIRCIHTRHAGHATELASEAVQQGYHIVVAVGGDGTVNEVANGLYGSKTAMGIIPCGSGNGLARHHRIPMKPELAIRIIGTGKEIDHDALRINGKLSFNVSGIGFDGRVAHLFGADGQRGFSGYLKLVVSEFKNYVQHRFHIRTGDMVRETKAMFIALANASQYGNGAKISPESDTGDGMGDFAVVKRMHGALVPFFAWKVFNGTVKTSPYFEHIRAHTITITCDPPAPLHIDGENGGIASLYEIVCERGALKLIVPA